MRQLRVADIVLVHSACTETFSCGCLGQAVAAEGQAGMAGTAGGASGSGEDIEHSGLRWPVIVVRVSSIV